MNIVELTQGSPEWLAYRREHFNASDAPAMMGCSPYKTRAELLREMHTGLTADVDASAQRRFDDGHRFEALARPLAEKIVGDDLYPLVGNTGKLSASFDGLTFGYETVFEHKTLGESLRYSGWDEGNGDHLPLHYRVQLEQQLLVSGADRALFMATRWASDNTEVIEARHCWYVADMALRAQIVSGWQQFAADLAAYTPPPLVEKAQAEPMDSLPAVAVRLDGALTVAGNLPSFAQALRAFIARMPKQPATDTDFATTDAACKALKKAEDALDAAEQGALASITDVEAMRRAVADCRKLARDTRLAAEKLVERRKVEIKEQAVTAARRALDDHIAGLNAELAPMSIRIDRVDFAAAIKGLRSIASMQDALDTAVASGKIAADSYARIVRANIATFKAQAAGLEFLFSDLGQIVHKPADDFAVIVQARIDTHRAAEAAREAKRKADEAARIAAATEQARRDEEERQQELQRQQAEAAAAAQRQAAAEVTPQQAPQQVLKAEPQAAEATDRGAPAFVSPRGGAMGAGQATAVAPIRAAAEPATLKLGVICERLGFTVSAAFLADALHVRAAETQGRAVLYRESQWATICSQLQSHISAMAEQYEPATA